MKLFVNSLIHKRFSSLSEVKKVLRKHLDALTKSKVQIKPLYKLWEDKGKNVVVARKKITQSSGKKSITALYYEGFRYLCPITNQPDNAKIKITGAFSNTDHQKTMQLGPFPNFLTASGKLQQLMQDQEAEEQQQKEQSLEYENVSTLI